MRKRLVMVTSALALSVTNCALALEKGSASEGSSSWIQSVFIDAAPRLLVLLIGGVAAVFVGRRVSHYWSLRQFVSQQDKAAAQQLSQSYGEFFSTWKLWNQVLKDISSADPEFEKKRWLLLDRACAAEGRVEAALLWLTSTRDLPSNTATYLGQFRQAFQTLRESIRVREPLPWGSSEETEYKQMKQRVVQVLSLVESGAGEPPVATNARITNWLFVTSNANEDTWLDNT